MTIISRLFAVLFIVLLHSTANSEEILNIGDVLDEVRETFPLILAAEQERNIAHGSRTAALGEFDLRWKTKATYVSPGYYDRYTLDSLIEKPIGTGGLDIYGGYRQGLGDFAIYDEKAKTMDSGEARFGLNIPLLRNREIDARRAGLAIADAGLDVADKLLQEKKIEIILKASIAYWKWVAAGRKLSIITDLFRIAKVRDRGLKERVSQGDIAEFERKDNQRGVLQRENQLFVAERSFQEAAFALSLFIRDAHGNPIVPTKEQLPKIIPPIVNRVLFNEKVLIEKASQQRPELARLRQERNQTDLSRQNADNQLMPQLDLLFEVSKDFGGVDPTRDPTELSSGIQLEVPLQRNKAQGKLAEAQAKQRKLDQELEYINQRIAADVKDAISALSISREQLAIVGKELGFARELEEGERIRFEAGESTILIVNLREQATADSALRQIDALVQYHMAEAYLQAALGEA